VSTLVNHPGQALFRFFGILFIWSGNQGHIESSDSPVRPGESDLSAGLEVLNVDLLEVNDL